MRYSKYNRNSPKIGSTPYEYRGKTDAGIPSKPQADGKSLSLNNIAFKDLTNQPITVKANPTAQATHGAVPYAIINRTNPVYEANYPGLENTAGNIIPQLVNSNQSGMLDMFDCGKIDLVLNYMYAAIQPSDFNQTLNIQLGKSTDEAMAKAYSEIFIELPFFKDHIDSNMINCDENKRTQAFIWYQTMLQNIASIPASYNKLMALEQHLKDMCYNRNVAPLDDIFGLLKKAAFKAKLTAFSNTITGEFFDMNWYRQINTLTMVPSRKTNSMRDPLLIIDAIHQVPSLKLTHSYNADAPSETVWYMNSDNYNVTVQEGASVVSFQEGIKYVINLLSPYNILKWARQLTAGTITTSPTAYFNNIVFAIESIRTVLNRFPSDVADIRTVLETANRVGINRWEQGVFFDLTKENSYQPVFNKLCHDVFTNYLAAPNDINFNETTLRWGFHTLWDEYLGIPKYDQVSGGAFLTFSTRDITTSPSTDTLALIPKLFRIESDEKANFVNRKGDVIDVTYSTMTGAQLTADSVYSRLNALGSTVYTQKIPTANVTGSNVIKLGSAVEYLLARLFGLGNITYLDGGSLVTNKTLNSEIICAVDVELEDVSNAMIAYAQAYAPFKVYTPTKTRTVGFNIGAPSI